MTITWGNVEFTGPHYLGSCAMPDSSGLYAIMIKPNPIGAPSTYTIIYFGESSNFEQRVNQYHHKYECWKGRVGSDNTLYYGLHIMPNSTEEQRMFIESQLIEKFQPSCND